jgi:chlorophyll synthase
MENFHASSSSFTALSASKKGPNEQVTDGSADVRQLLGVKGAAGTTEKWKIRLQLTKPVTWIPLVWGVMCGAAASGNYHWIWNPFDPNDRDVVLGLTDTAKGFVAMILAGPFLTGYTQTINDWYDREIDAINEPYRPIPSGAISEGEVIAQILFLLFGGLGIAYGLDVWAGHEFPTVLALSIFGSFISYIYSAPPLKLKQNGWAGNFALGASYISLPWWCGQAVFGQLDKPVYWILYVFVLKLTNVCIAV